MLRKVDIFSEMPKERQGQEGQRLGFFMWLDRFLDMVTEIWMLIISNAAYHREMQRRIDGTSTSAELGATRFEIAALSELNNNLTAQSVKLQFLQIFFLFLTSLSSSLVSEASEVKFP